MAARFVTALFPVPSAFIFSLMAAPLVLSLALYGIPKIDVRRVPLLIWIILAVALLHIGGLWIGPTDFWRPVLRDMIFVGVLSVLFLFGTQAAAFQATKLHRGFFDALIPTGLIMSFLGLVKIALISQGLVDPTFLIQHTNIRPWGSSFASDYNMAGLTLVTAAIGVILRRHKPADMRDTVLRLVIPLVVLGSACALTTSRRVLFALPLLIMFWLFIGMRNSSRKLIVRHLFFPLILVICCVTFITWGMSRMGSTGTSEDYRAPSHYYAPSSVLSTVADGSFLDGRYYRWQLGWGLLKKTNGIGASGFAYHEIFACKFRECRELDYPHMFLISELLIGGIAGGALSIAFFVLLFMAVVRNGWNGVEQGSSIVFAVVLPFAFVSGDTLISVPQLVAAALMVCATGYAKPVRQEPNEAVVFR